MICGQSLSAGKVVQLFTCCRRGVRNSGLRFYQLERGDHRTDLLKQVRGDAALDDLDLNPVWFRLMAKAHLAIAVLKAAWKSPIRLMR